MKYEDLDPKEPLRKGDEFLPPEHWKQPIAWTRIKDDRAGGTQCSGVRYRRPYIEDP